MSDNSFIHKEAFFMLTDGGMLGQGIARKVYASTLNPDWVIKVEEGGRSFQNVKEWEMWKFVHDSPHAKWFAPCLSISASGSVLIQKRTEPMERARYPKSVPAYFTDLHYDNFGMLDKKFVIHDYGMLLNTQDGLTNRMRVAKWWKVGV
jgi:hypothetical protein